MANAKRKPRLVREPLKFVFPQPQSPAVAPTAVGHDQELARLRIQPPSFMAPPPPDRCHRKCSRIVIGTDIDESGVASEIVDAVRIGTRHIRAREVVPLNGLGCVRRTPLLSRIVVVADQFLLLGIHRDDRQPLPQVLLDAGIDMAKLRIAIRMLRTLFGLAITLQAVVEIVQNLRHLGVADRMTLVRQLCGNGPRTQADPAQRRLRITAGLLVDQLFQNPDKTWIGIRDRLAPRASAAYPPRTRHRARLNLPNAFTDRLARQTTGMLN